jgi:hypothetical protein
MMTVREALGRKMRRAIATAFAGVGLFLVQAIVPAPGPPLFVFAGMAVFFSAAMYGIGYVLAYGDSPFWVSKRLRFCPYCGLELDTPLASVKRAA